MDPSFLLIQFLNGLATASTLFIAACGLTIIFGVTRIVNFAHGSFYMLGAYLAVTFIPRLLEIWYGPVSFWIGILAAAVAVGLLGVVMEVLLLRRIYKAPELFQLLATFGVVLVVQDLVIATWGADDILGPRAPVIRGAIEIAGEKFPRYELLMIAAGPAVLLGVWLLLRRTRFGVLVRAATQDREMVSALGVNQKVLFTSVLFLGAALAGLGGALQTPRAPATPLMDVDMISEAFVVTVIGGMGSVPGAFLAALVIGQLQAFGIVIFPKITLVLIFLVMAIVLVVRPYGLLGRAEAVPNTVFEGDKPLKPFSGGALLVLAVLYGILLFLPILVDSFSLKLAIEVMVFALLAASLGLLLSVGGIISFGHAAYFGLGAYGAALLATHLETPMELGLVLAPLSAALGAALFGFFVVRLSGVYLAMLTLAFAQIVYAVAFQWVEVTGGDNGIIGIWPSSWASERVPYYYLTLIISTATLVMLYRIVHAPFGYTLRAGRDSTVRADAIGIDVRHHRWLAFILSGAAAGAGGGLYVYSKGNIDPGVLAIPTSVDALAMVLLGGVQTLVGPLVGAAGLHLLKDFVMPLTDYWRMILGSTIIALVLLFPQGIAGASRQALERIKAQT